MQSSLAAAGALPAEPLATLTQLRELARRHAATVGWAVACVEREWPRGVMKDWERLYAALQLPFSPPTPPVGAAAARPLRPVAPGAGAAAPPATAPAAAAAATAAAPAPAPAPAPAARRNGIAGLQPPPLHLPPVGLGSQLCTPQLVAALQGYIK